MTKTLKQIIASIYIFIIFTKNVHAEGRSFDIKDIFQPAKRFNTAEGIGVLASDVILFLTSIAGAIAFIFIIISGIKFVTSGGDEKKLAAAKGTLTYAIIGLAIVIFAFIILGIVQFFIGSDVPIT